MMKQRHDIGNKKEWAHLIPNFNLVVIVQACREVEGPEKLHPVLRQSVVGAKEAMTQRIKGKLVWPLEVGPQGKLVGEFRHEYERLIGGEHERATE